MAKKISRNSLSHRVAAWLGLVGILPRRDLAFTFLKEIDGVLVPRTDDRHFRRMVSGLIEDGFVTIKRRDNCTYCYLTARGYSECRRLGASFSTEISINDIQDPKRFWKIVRRAEVINLMRAGGYMPDNKPSLDLLLKVMNRNNIDSASLKSLQPFISQMASGPRLNIALFYSTAEIRQLLQEQGKLEFLFRSRVLGVILTKGEVYFVYNTLNRLLRWYESNERKAIIQILNLFENYRPYAKLLNQLQRPYALVLGKSEAMTAAIVTGHKHGRVKHPGAKDLSDVHLLLNQLNYVTSKSLYESIYVIPSNKFGLNAIPQALTYTKEMVANLNRSVAKTNPTLYQYSGTSEQRYVQLRNMKTGTPTMLALWLDTNQLGWARSHHQTVDVICPASYGAFISKSLGRVMGKVIDYGSGEEVEVPQYDGLGNLVL